MTLSVVTICFNSAKTIADTIESVLSQDYSDLEYIIKDGGSTDGTLEIIKSYGDIVKLVSAPDEGLYDAMAQGMLLCTGEAIGIINSDDIYPDKSVLTRVAQTFQNTKADTVYGDLEYVAEDNVNAVTRKWESGNYDRKAFLKGWMPPHPTFFIRKEFVDKYGVFDKSFKSAGDYEFMLRMLYKHNLTAAYIPHVQMKMRAGGVSNASLKNRIRANKEDRRAWRINNIKPRWYTLWWKPLSKLVQWIK